MAYPAAMTHTVESPDTDERQAALTQLLQALRGHELVADMIGSDVVRVSQARTPDVEIDLRCGPRGIDGGRLWFFADEGRPVSPADQIFEAIPTIKGLTSARL